ncbi:MAG: hypothetical protein RLZZ230_98 [Candidatus Parcubacteria bacterium]|jgi:hypothetical protein
MNIKQQFPNEEALKFFIAEQIDSFTKTIKDSVGDLEVDYIKKSRQRIWGITLIGTGIVIWTVFAVLELINPWIQFVLLSSSFAFVIAGLYKIAGTKQAIEAFNIAFNNALYPIVFQIFSLAATLAKKTEERELKVDEIINKSPWRLWWTLFSIMKFPVVPQYNQVIELLDHSELITEPRNMVVVDNIFQIDIEGRVLLVSELDAKHVTGSGKNRHTKRIFTGYFVAFELLKPLSGKTFVSSEGDNNGFGHQSFINSLLDRGVEETKLEWNDFENLLRVMSDNPTEARYILTPDFMSDLYGWWLDKKDHVRLSFVDNRMYMLFPDNRLRFDATVANISPDEIKSYLESICLPLLHVLHLVEDIEDRFNR